MNHIQKALSDYLEIEHMFYVHGGDRESLEKKGKTLAKMTTMSLKEAISKVIFEDQQTKKAPIGILNYH